MAVTKTSHIHKFKRLTYKSGNAIFFCALPDCNQKLNINLALGKRSLCWRCGNEFIMNEYSLRLAKPHCEGCHKPKKIDNDEEIHESTREEAENYSLAKRLQQTIKQAQPQIEIEEEEI